ncbi:hypothetical protein ACIPV3_25050 [Streptomyces albidoflavus]
MAAERYFWHLSAAQSDGVACVICNRDFLKNRVNTVTVGRSPESDTAVFACLGPCADGIARQAEEMAREMREAAGRDPDDESHDEFHVGADNQFGHLLRDLRVLVGMESLLAVVDNLPQLRYLLGMTATHAETAMARARWVIARIDKEGEGE